MGQLLVFALHQSILNYVSIADICNVLASGLTDTDKTVFHIFVVFDGLGSYYGSQS